MAANERWVLCRNTSLILAYGSNLLWERMEGRCPDAEPVGTTVIPGYRMLFKESMTGAYCTVEQDANSFVPAAVYRISFADEARLDRAEGCPKYYYKREFFLLVFTMDGKKMRGRKSCIAYVLREHRMLGEPSDEYYRIVERGYAEWGFDDAILQKALSDSIGSKAAEKWLKKHSRKGNT